MSASKDYFGQRQQTRQGAINTGSYEVQGSLNRNWAARTEGGSFITGSGITSGGSTRTLGRYMDAPSGPSPVVRGVDFPKVLAGLSPAQAGGSKNPHTGKYPGEVNFRQWKGVATAIGYAAQPLAQKGKDWWNARGGAPQDTPQDTPPDDHSRGPLPRAVRSLPLAVRSLPLAVKPITRAGTRPLPLATEPLPLATEPLPLATEPLPRATEPLPRAVKPLPLQTRTLQRHDADAVAQRAREIQIMRHATGRGPGA